MAKEKDPVLEGVDELLAVAERKAQHAASREAVALANAVAKDERCSVATDIVNAWNGIKETDPKDPSFKAAKAAAALLDKCRKKTINGLIDGVRSLMIDQRKQWANRYETGLLDEGLDVRVKLSGKYKDRVTIQFVLFNRAWVHKITDGGSMAAGGFLSNLQEIGFKRVTFSDGFYESFYHDLEPATEEQAAAESTGLGYPFKL